MNNVNPFPRPGNEGQPGLLCSVSMNVGIPTFWWFSSGCFRQ
ncbi:hypothetical protein HMPREF1549_02851 [Actinomyces johnsonii F0510]|uniref:Uncharacterized protein n=1 Tax=Actinomyces johnsonii F0510 TaxID=1227262 RepID=U1R8C0_9ACTO|nr:hypothetical protein HMPREF1549_02851 [Actinomyces johnsonii F0510]